MRYKKKCLLSSFIIVFYLFILETKSEEKLFQSQIKKKLHRMSTYVICIQI